MTEFNLLSFRLSAAIACCVLLIITNPAVAGTGGGRTWASPLQRLTIGCIGPVAQWLLLLASPILVVALAFSESARVRRVLGVVLGATIAATLGIYTPVLSGLLRGVSL